MNTNEPRITIDTIAPHAVKVTVEHQAFGVYEYHQHDLEGARAELMEGGVTPALIENEAQVCSDPDAHWRLDEALARAERAERERDEWKDSAIKAMADLERAEHPHSLTPDAITDEARDRAYRAVAALSVCDWDDMSGVAKGRAMAVVEAVITEITRPEPPARPEGAEEIEALIDRAGTEGEGADNESLADYLTRCGVRVVGEERS